MINFVFNGGDSLVKIEKELGGLSGKSRLVLARSVNETAKKARSILAKKAQESYEVKQGSFNKAMTIKKASQANPTAIIQTKGRAVELKSFKVSPASYNPSNRPKVTKARVLRGGAMKPLAKDGIKAFIVKYANGHVAVAERQSGDQYPIKGLYSVSVPSMIGSQRHVYGVLKPEIERILNEQVQRQINRVLAGKG